MSRSNRKRPFCGNTTSESEKQDKGIFHKKWRRTSKQQLSDIEDLDDLVFDTKREVSNVYGWAKDGKRRFDPEHSPECMRK